MAAARPSQASLANVIAAMKAEGLEIGEIKVAPDGGFTVATREAVDRAAATVTQMPRKFSAG